MTNQFTELDAKANTYLTELDCIADEELMSSSGGGFFHILRQISDTPLVFGD